MFLKEENRELYTKIVLVFMSADIPLAKLRNDALKNLFNEIKAPLPSESTSRIIVTELIDDYPLKLTMVFANKDIFFISDESEINSEKFIIILAGDIKVPINIYCIDCIHISEALNYVLIENSINNTVQQRKNENVSYTM